MPYYRVMTTPDLLDASLQEAFTGDVVEVHCGVTGVPASSVHVVYADGDETLPEGAEAAVVGAIRAGRTEEQKAEIVEQLSRRLANLAGIDPAAVAVVFHEVEAPTLEAS